MGVQIEDAESGKDQRNRREERRWKARGPGRKCYQERHREVGEAAREQFRIGGWEKKEGKGGVVERQQAEKLTIMNALTTIRTTT